MIIEQNVRCDNLEIKILSTIEEFLSGFENFPGLKHKGTSRDGSGYLIKFKYLGSAFLGQIKILKGWKDNIEMRTTKPVYALEIRQNINDNPPLCRMLFDFRGKPIGMKRDKTCIREVERQSYSDFTRSVIKKLLTKYNL
jgi:hypothetical protein